MRIWKLKRLWWFTGRFWKRKRRKKWRESKKSKNSSSWSMRRSRNSTRSKALEGSSIGFRLCQSSLQNSFKHLQLLIWSIRSQGSISEILMRSILLVSLTRSLIKLCKELLILKRSSVFLKSISITLLNLSRQRGAKNSQIRKKTSLSIIQLYSLKKILQLISLMF